MHLKHTITFAAIAGILLAAGCGSTKEAKKSELPSITSETTPFIRITDLAYMDLVIAARRGKDTPSKEVVESEIKRQRVVGTLTLERGDLYIPYLMNHKDRESILTIDSGVEKWALVKTALWDGNKAFMTAGVIPVYEYKNYLGTLRKAVKRK